MPHMFTCRVYYEDTDLAGIVYYANYLKFIERARSEFVRAQGIDQRALRDGPGLVFAVRRLVCDYLAPARFDDVLDVRTTVTGLTPARLGLHQTVSRGPDSLFAADVTLVCLQASGRPARLPAEVRQSLGGGTAT